MKEIAKAVIQSAQRYDRDTFFLVILAVLSFAALVAGTDWLAVVGVASALAILYVACQFLLSYVRARERRERLRTDVPHRMDELLKLHATEDEYEKMKEFEPWSVSKRLEEKS